MAAPIDLGGTCYIRQRPLTCVSAPVGAVVIGLGGVGSWVALELAMAGTERIVMLDDDVVEGHNLNRTLFKTSHIGMPKVDAVAELIAERRPDCEILPFVCRSDTLPAYVREMIHYYTVFDCRDSIEPLCLDTEGMNYITGGYDGTSVTIHLNPVLDSVFGTANVEYRIVPSYVGAPALIAAIIVNYACLYEMRSDAELVLTFDIRNLISIINRGLEHGQSEE